MRRVTRVGSGTRELKASLRSPRGPGMGLARGLVEAAISSARRQGCAELRLDTLASMAQAQALYRSFGFVEIRRMEPITCTAHVLRAVVNWLMRCRVMRSRAIAIFRRGHSWSPWLCSLSTMRCSSRRTRVSSRENFPTSRVSPSSRRRCSARFLDTRVLSTWHAICGAFLWWKSPASGAFISYMNEMQPLTIGRTMDYGDLIALAVLPLCSRLRRTSHAAPGLEALRRWLLPPVLAVDAVRSDGNLSSSPDSQGLRSPCH